MINGGLTAMAGSFVYCHRCYYGDLPWYRLYGDRWYMPIMIKDDAFLALRNGEFLYTYSYMDINHLITDKPLHSY